VVTFINLAPDARGVENMARAFREGIAEAERRMIRAETLAENDLGEYDIYQPDLGLIQEGLWTIVEREEKRIASLQEGLDACQLALAANQILLALSGLGSRLELDGEPNEAERVREAIDVIVKLAGKAGMKG
jgi:energy-converting hydrogenase Eha subunit H